MLLLLTIAIVWWTASVISLSASVGVRVVSAHPTPLLASVLVGLHSVSLYDDDLVSASTVE